MNFREMLTTWGFKVEHEKLDKVEKQLEGIKHRLDFLAAAEVVKGLFELADRFGSVGEAIHIAAESAGITVEAFQKLAFSAAQANISQQELEVSMKHLARSLYAARTGAKEAQEAFAHAGFTPGQVRGFKTSQDAMLALADRMKGMHDPIQKAALAQAVLGRGSLHMVAYLSQGSQAIKNQGDEAERLGIVLSGGQVMALMKFEHAWKKVTAVVKSFAAIIASDMAPVFTLMIEDFIKFFNVNRGILQLNLDNWLKNLAFGMGFVWEAVKYGIELLIRIAKAFNMEGQIIPTIAMIAGLITGLMALGKTLEIVTWAWDLMKLGMSPFIFLAGAVKKALSWLILELAAATDSEILFGIAGAIAEAPLWAIVAAIAAVVLGAQALWKVLTGGNLSDSWIGQIGSLMGKGASGLMSWMTGSGASAADKIGGMAPNLGAAMGVPGMVGVPNDFGNNGQNTSSVQVNAPVTVNVPPGTPANEVGKHVQDGIRDHLDRTMRETRASTLSPVHY